MTFHEVRFEGYVPVSDPGPANYPGIYCVFAGKIQCSYRLLYIGEACDEIGSRISSHNKKRCWERMAESMEAEENRLLWFTTYEIRLKDLREQLEAALIFKLQPPCNTQNRKKYSRDSIEISIFSDVLKLNIPVLHVEKDETRDPCGSVCECPFDPPCNQ